MNTEVINSLGKLAGWNSIGIRILGRDVVGVKSIAYDDEKEIDNEMGAGGYPVGETDGNYKAKASIELLNEEVVAIMKSLPRGKRIQDIAGFNIIVSYEYENEVIKDVLKNCRFKINGVDVKQGDGSITRKFDLKISHIEWNQ